ncbi:hypothetical protein L596_015967 [Steinernema carpocapsae]|uniref:Uncharacterized protein n=1 Tax=Steinernema carpocapsae TaxID=34508 RepID=A0A4U5NHJ4_STECR|nr:hypothetical protein L596_015967 [Steinernema carpocapsae]
MVAEGRPVGTDLDAAGGVGGGVGDASEDSRGASKDSGDSAKGVFSSASKDSGDSAKGFSAPPAIPPRDPRRPRMTLRRLSTIPRTAPRGPPAPPAAPVTPPTIFEMSRPPAAPLAPFRIPPTASVASFDGRVANGASVDVGVGHLKTEDEESRGALDSRCRRRGRR